MDIRNTTYRGQMRIDDPKAIVRAKLRPSTIGCSKTFTGNTILSDTSSSNDDLQKWLRLIPAKLTVSWSTIKRIW